MDILISSNLERLIYRIAGNDADKNRELMAALSGQGKYEISADMKAALADFYGNYANEAETADEIKRLYRSCGYVIDTHTAVASAVYQKYLKENLVRPTDDNCKDIKGEVVLSFFVDEEGKPQNITVIHGLCEFADKEAIRLVKEGPKWTSGKLPARVTVRF